MRPRHLSAADRLIFELDKGLRTIVGVEAPAARPNPAQDQPEPELSGAERALSAGLMRVNHAGEIAAQALYQGQALTAKDPTIRDAMRQAGEEETDHLIWCRQRLDELGARPSVLDPVWYVGSLGLGALAGLVGDKVSLGFLAETEKQVVEHLEGHLERLPEADQKSRRILEQMKEEEAEHETAALTRGAIDLPSPVQRLMRRMAKVMTKTAFWV